MDQETAKLYGMKAEVLRAIAQPLRLAILDFLSQGEQCVCDVATHIDTERSNASRHLGVMLRAGILECRKDGLRVLYSLKTPCVLNFLSCVSQVLRERMERDRAVLQGL